MNREVKQKLQASFNSNGDEFFMFNHVCNVEMCSKINLSMGKGVFYVHVVFQRAHREMYGRNRQ